MGQRLNECQRTQLLAHPEVKAVTLDHVILRSGRMLDPADFWFQRETVYFIKKLLECGRCLFRHQPGMHIVVQGYVERTVLGQTRYVCDGERHCCGGDWTTEEMLCVDQARSVGLLDSSGRPVCKVW